MCQQLPRLELQQPYLVLRLGRGHPGPACGAGGRQAAAGPHSHSCLQQHTALPSQVVEVEPGEARLDVTVQQRGGAQRERQLLTVVPSMAA